MDKSLSVWRYGTPEQLRRLARAYQKAALMKDPDDSGEKERLFLQAGRALGIARIRERRAREAARENDRLVNLAARRWFKEAKVQPDPYHLHLLTLAQWGFENGAEGDWPEDLRDAVEIQLEDLAQWKSEHLMKWLFANDTDGSPYEQEQGLLHDLKTAKNPLDAAEFVLCTIWWMMIQDAA